MAPRPESAEGRRPGYTTVNDGSGNWNTINSGEGNNERVGIQTHYGRGSNWSTGCIVLPEFDEFWMIIAEEYENGGVTLMVRDVCGPPCRIDLN